MSPATLWRAYKRAASEQALAGRLATLHASHQAHGDHWEMLLVEMRRDRQRRKFDERLGRVFGGSHDAFRQWAVSR
ncbi:MAG TPA: hypothetical protein VD948_08615 [Rhodothermales bacterium]|nr:hypothetical protein [Rhodothermales bacterium]